jgi:hypothetical protein
MDGSCGLSLEAEQLMACDLGHPAFKKLFKVEKYQIFK